MSREFDGAAFDRWLTTEPEEGPDCPECGGPVEDGECINPDCETVEVDDGRPDDDEAYDRLHEEGEI